MWKYANGLNTLLLHTKSIHIFLLKKKKIENIMKKIHPLIQKFFKSKLLHNVVYNWSKLGGGISLVNSFPLFLGPCRRHLAPETEQQQHTNTNLIISERVKLPTYPNTNSHWERQGWLHVAYKTCPDVKSCSQWESKSNSVVMQTTPDITGQTSRQLFVMSSTAQSDILSHTKSNQQNAHTHLHIHNN